MADAHQHVTETSVDDLTTAETVDPTDVSPYEEGQNRVVSQRISVFGTLGYDDEPDQGGVYDDFPGKNLEQGDAYDVLPQRTHSDVYQDTYQTTSPVYEVYDEGKKEKEKPEPKYMKLTFARQIIFGACVIGSTVLMIVLLVVVGVVLANLDGEIDKMKSKTSKTESRFADVESKAQNSGIFEINATILSLNESVQNVSVEVGNLNEAQNYLNQSLQYITSVLSETNDIVGSAREDVNEIKPQINSRNATLVGLQNDLASEVERIGPIEENITSLNTSVHNLENK